MSTISVELYENCREVFRCDVLAAMDSVMEHLTAHIPNLEFPDKNTGARDADLPKLFRAIDSQFDLNLKHGGIEAVVGTFGNYTVL